MSNDTSSIQTSAGKRRFTFKRVLSKDEERKTICIECTTKSDFCQTNDDEMPAVLILEKVGFDEDTSKDILLDFDLANQKALNIMENDIYSTYMLDDIKGFNKIKMTIICPATEKHILKYSSIMTNIVKETKELYETVVKPYITESYFSTDWITNILNGTAEKEHYVFICDDPQYEFVLLHDYHWDGLSIDNLHLLAIMKRSDIRSLRDINRSHVDYFMFILEKSFEVIKDKFGLSSSRVRAFFHYPPSFYHLHIHFTNLSCTSCNINTDRAHLVYDVIDNLNICANYYQTKTLYYCLKVVDPLLAVLEEKTVNK